MYTLVYNNCTYCIIINNNKNNVLEQVMLQGYKPLHFASNVSNN